ncbi:MAG TPA: amidohydrolase family protein [Thermomicrobiales bacterium]|nr:amidohydrolase family protein [Thermomicrobiales bacterium]
MSQFDLLLQGGDVFDPASGQRGRFDVGFVGDSLAAIEPQIDSSGARNVVQATGCLVVPGLVDVHTHVFETVGESVSADEACLTRGTTTVVDGGSAGANLFEAFLRLTGGNRARVLAWLNLSTIGQVDIRVGELLALPHADVEAAVTTARLHPSLIVGLKARLSTYVVGGTAKPVLRLLREAADAAGLPIMVHVGDTGEPLPEIFEFLRPGDIVTHILTGRKNGILDGAGKIIPEAFEARERGILFDASRGRNHEAFPVLQATVEQGLLPDTVSTDITRATARNRDFGLPLLATHLLSFGVPLEEVIARITLNAANAIRRGELGRLQVGGVADATLLQLEEGKFALQDVDGRIRWTDQRLVAVGTVRAGAYSERPRKEAG